jgi:plasmid replication initiation protein
MVYSSQSVTIMSRKPKAKKTSLKKQTIQRVSAPSLVTQDNALITACYRMTLNEKRLLMLGIAKIDPTKSPSRASPLEFDITVAEWAAAYRDEPDAAYKAMDRASKCLIRRQVSINGRSDSVQLVNWLDRCQYHKGEGRISVRFGWTLSHYLTGFYEQFTSVNLLDIRALGSFHAIRLYEILIQFRTTGYRVLNLSEFRSILDLSGCYPRFADLKRRVIDYAVADINKNTDLDVTCYEVKQGRKVVQLRFAFEEKRQKVLDI